MGIVCFLYHHFGIYKEIPKAAGSWVERKRKGGREEGRESFLRVFSSCLEDRPLEAQKSFWELSDRRSGLHCSYFHG